MERYEGYLTDVGLWVGHASKEEARIRLHGDSSAWKGRGSRMRCKGRSARNEGDRPGKTGTFCYTGTCGRTGGRQCFWTGGGLGRDEPS